MINFFFFFLFILIIVLIIFVILILLRILLVSSKTATAVALIPPTGAVEIATIGVEVYPDPPSAIVIDAILPSCSFNTAVNCASVVADPPLGTSEGMFLYPKP